MERGDEHLKHLGFCPSPPLSRALSNMVKISARRLEENRNEGLLLSSGKYVRFKDQNA